MQNEQRIESFLERSLLSNEEFNNFLIDKTAEYVFSGLSRREARARAIKDWKEHPPVLRDYLQSDQSSINPIQDDAFGKGYIDVASLTPNNCILAFKDEIVGMIYGEIIESTAELKTVVVDPDYRNVGIASRLVKEFMSRCESSGVKRITSPAWKVGDGIPAERLLLRFGFVATKIIEGYWTEDSQARGYRCPTCGFPCSCDAVIFEYTY